MDLTGTGWKRMDWTHLIQDRDQLRDLVNTVMNFQFPKDARKFLD
jgi:hypothetical protein